MMSLTGENSADILPDPLSMTGRETGIGSSCAGVRPMIGSPGTEVVADTPETVIVVAASTAIEVTANLVTSGSPVEV